MSFVKKNWLGICSIIAIGISGFFLYGFVGHTNASKKIGEITGSSLAYSTLVFFVANSLRKKLRRKKLEFWIFCFSVCFLLSSISNSLIRNKQVSQLNNTGKEFARLAKDLEKISPEISMNEYSFEKYGDFSKVFPILKKSFEFSERVTAEINAVRAELENLLNPKNLCKYEQIIHARNMVANISVKLNHFEQEYENEITFTREKIKEALSKYEDIQIPVLSGFDNSRKTSGKLITELFNIEKEGIQKIDDILNFLSTRTGTFWQSDEILIFEKDEDVEKFNDLVQILFEHTQKEEALIEKLQKHKRTHLQKMKDFDKPK